MQENLEKDKGTILKEARIKKGILLLMMII